MAPQASESSTTTTVQKAKTYGASGQTTKSHKIIVSEPYMEILIGGEYTDVNKETHTYGHAAIHIVTNEKDLTYDFGRYGKTWGAFDSEGEGILNVWSVFKPYIQGESILKRVTIGFVYYMGVVEANAVNSYFSSLIASNKEIRSKRASITRYVLRDDYHPTTNNCTTMVLNGAKQSGKKIVHNPKKYQEMRGLSWTERQGARTKTWPEDGIFMPADLQAMIEGNTEAPYDKKNIYKY